jgi:protein TonB
MEPGVSADRVTDARQSSGEAVKPVDPEDVTSYRLRLAGIAGRFKRYPLLARERGQEGMVEVRVRVGPGLSQPQVTLGRSSGIEVLDEAAVETVTKASQGIDLPPGLRGRTTDIPVPVYFRLD